MKLSNSHWLIPIFFVLVACSDDTPQSANTSAPAHQPVNDSAMKTIEVQEPKVEFALECLSDNPPKRRGVFVSLGKNAMFTNFFYRIQYSLDLMDTTPQNYTYRVNREYTGKGAVSLSDTTITVDRETLKLLYAYNESFGAGVDPFSCKKIEDPIKAHEESKQLLINEAQKSAEAAEKSRIDTEKANEAQLKRNKI